MDFEKFFQHIRPDLYVLWQALVSLLLGGLIGWERKAAGKWAGLRTYMLVCLASMLLIRVDQFLIVQTQEFLIRHAQPSPDHVILRTDPIRMIEAIVTGIAFLGAGMIFRDRDVKKMHGLTTAASLLIVAPIGVAIAINRYVLAVGITLITLFVLRVMRKLEAKLTKISESDAG